MLIYHFTEAANKTYEGQGESRGYDFNITVCSASETKHRPL